METPASSRRSILVACCFVGALRAAMVRDRVNRRRPISSSDRRE